MFSYFNTPKIISKGVQYLLLAGLSVSSSASFATFDCAFNLSSTWDSGAVATVTITNLSTEVRAWEMIRATFSGEVIIARVWNNRPIAPGDTDGTLYPLEWNKTLAPGQSADVGMQLRFPSGYKLQAPILSGDCEATPANTDPISEFSAVVESGEFEGTIYVDASASYDVEGELLTYQWYLNGEKQSDETAITSFYVATGAYDVTLQVNDGELSAQQTQSVNVGTTFSADIQQDISGFSVRLDASASTSSEQIVDYLWDFGDGASGRGEIVDHTYDSAGTYPVTLTLVTLTGSDVSVIDVSLRNTGTLPPVVDFSCRNQVLVADMFEIGAGITKHMLECVSSSADPEGDPLSYLWQSGDGAILGNDNRFAHAFVNDGDVEVTLTVSDGTHNPLLTQSFTVIGNSVPPTGALNCTEQSLDALCVIEIADTDSKVNAAIIWGDGDVERVESGEWLHRYAEPGEYSITLYIWDKSNVKQLTQNVVVVSEQNSPPIITDLSCIASELISENPELRAAIVQNLSDCSARVEDAEGDQLFISWDFGDGSDPIESDNVYWSYQYEEGGTYTITLTASDGINTVAESIEFDALGNGKPIHPTLSCTTEELAVSCTVAGFYPDGSSQNAAIIWGDGESTRYVGGDISYTYASPGDYEITAYVWSKHRVGSSRQSVVVATASPAVTCEYQIVGSWGNYFQAQIRVTNTGDIAVTDWGVEWAYDDDSNILNLWGGLLSGSNPYRVIAYNWNAALAPGQSAQVGMRGTFGGESPNVPLVTCN